VAERICDEKSGEWRGDQLKITTPPIACFRKIFAAQIPPSPQSDQGRKGISKPEPQRQQTVDRVQYCVCGNLITTPSIAAVATTWQLKRLVVWRGSAVISSMDSSSALGGDSLLAQSWST
jgi:hypothetical protein